MLSRKLDLHRILFLGGSLSLIIVYILSWVDVISDPNQRTEADFMAFYAAGRSVVEHTPAAAYDLAYTKEYEEKVLGYRIAEEEVMSFNHPPLTLPILWLAAHFEYVPAFHIWAGFLLILCGFCAHTGVKLFPEARGISKIALWIGVFLFFPLFISIVNGQDSALLLLGTLIWYYGFTQGSSRTAGLGLALTTIRPQIAMVLAVPFFFNASWRKVWWWFCLGGVVLIVASIIMVGWEGIRNLLNILSISAAGEGYKMNERAMVNLIGLINRLLPDLNAVTIRLIGWTGYLVGLAILSLIWKSVPIVTNRHISLATIIAVFFSPHLHYHDLALLILPILVAIHWLIAAQKVSTESAVLLPICVSFIFIFTYSVLRLNYAVVYLVEVALLISIWLMGKQLRI
ncbi:MAG TPA: glycosyltransferase family 87 protein [Anaerolineales bacterium]|nr:glycosyltransferase family 87 protein [Anaerolineales bacterium]